MRRRMADHHLMRVRIGFRLLVLYLFVIYPNCVRGRAFGTCLGAPKQWHPFGRPSSSAPDAELEQYDDPERQGAKYRTFSGPHSQRAPRYRLPAAGRGRGGGPRGVSDQEVPLRPGRGPRQMRRGDEGDTMKAYTKGWEQTARNAPAWDTSWLGGRSRYEGEGRRLFSMSRKLLAVRRGTAGGFEGSSNPNHLNYNALLKQCAKDKGARKGILSEEEERLAACLKRPRASCPHNPQEIRKTINSLPGFRLMDDGPPCMVVHRGGSPPPGCASSSGNKETGEEPWTNRMRAKIRGTPGGGKTTLSPPSADLLDKPYQTCALVGNAPQIKGADNGKYINKFSAVVRFNQIHKQDPAKGKGRYMGTKTTFRMFSRSVSFDLAEGKSHIQAGLSEKGWLFWHDKSKFVLSAIKRRGADVPLMMLAPGHINWQMDVYFQLRRDMRRLGLGPFGCPRNINSGMHAMLAMQHLCSQVGLFGISHLRNLATRLGGHIGDPLHQPSRFHSWDFDTLVVRLMHMSGRTSVCTV